MKSLLSTRLALVLAGMLMATSPAGAATLLGDMLADNDIEVGVDMSMDFYDKYVWRGFKLDGDNVMQSNLGINVAGFEAGFWGSWDLQSKDGLASDEVDGWIGYSTDLGFLNIADLDTEKFSIGFGNTWYDFPEADLYTKELYLTLSIDMLLQPYFTWYHDYGDEAQGGADGNYFAFGIGHSLTLSEEYGITLDLGGELGLNNEAFIAGDGGYMLATAGLGIPLTDQLSMSPMIGLSVPFGDLEDAADGNQDDEFYGGISLAASF